MLNLWFKHQRKGKKRWNKISIPVYLCTMVIRQKYNWFRMLFVLKGSVLPRLAPRLIGLFLFCILITYYHGIFFHVKVSLNAAPFTLMGVALAIFLGFRNSAAYDRFWEGRKLWGALLNNTRSLARQALTMTKLPNGDPQVQDFIQLLISFTYALKHQLRKTDAGLDMERLLPASMQNKLEGAQYKPIILLREMSAWVQARKEAGQLDSIQQSCFNRNLDNLSDIVGGCERIASTPIPYTYNVLLHRTVYLYCFLLPFGLVDSIGWVTPLIVTFIGYTFIALDAIIDDIEDPFGDKPNHLALNAMSRMIEHTLREEAGQPILAGSYASIPIEGYYLD
jgi:putative membrane protein